MNSSPTQFWTVVPTPPATPPHSSWPVRNQPKVESIVQHQHCEQLLPVLLLKRLYALQLSQCRVLHLQQCGFSFLRFSCLPIWKKNHQNELFLIHAYPHFSSGEKGSQAR